MFLTGGNSFRKAIYPEYKGNRSQPKPKWLQEVRDWLINECNAVVAKDGLEADDELTIAQTEDTIICSLDKDLLQIQGKHFSWQIEGGSPDKRWMKPDKFTTQTELEGLRVFYQQCLKGDSSDNIKGALGIGEKKAEQKLKDCTTEKEMIEVCLGEYFTEEEFLMNAQCLYLLRTYDDSYLTRFERVLNED
jgi:DNA polymerase-1